MLGKTDVKIKIGDFSSSLNVYVVEKMADNVFIIGRDILETSGCIIDYKTLTFKIGKTSIPLLKATTSKICAPALQLHCSKTTIVPPFSQGHIPCHLRSKKASSKRVFSSISGISEMTLKTEGLLAEGSMQNTSRGKTQLHVINISENPVYIYRNKKVGKFTTFHVAEVNTINESQKVNMSIENQETAPGVSNNKLRWTDNIQDLYNILKLDQLAHLNSSQISQIKNLIFQNRNIFSMHDDDLGLTDMLPQKIILKTDKPIRDKYYNIPLSLRKYAEKEIKRLLDLNIIEPSS